MYLSDVSFVQVDSQVMSCSSCGRASSTVCGCRTNRCCRYVSLLGGTIQHDFSGREGNLSWTCGHIKIPSIHLPPLNPGPGRSSSCLSRDTQTSLSPECPGSPPGGTCQEHFLREAFWGHPKQMPEPPPLAPPGWQSASPYLWRSALPPCGGNSFWLLVSRILFFWSWPKVYDHRWR